MIAFLSNYMATYLQYIQLSLHTLYLEDGTTLDEKRTLKYLQQICYDHQNAIRLINVMDKTFYLVYFFKFLIYSVFYCILFFILILVNDKHSILTRLILVITFQLESLILCYYGDKLRIEGENVAHAAYDIKWYNTSARAQKYIIMIITAGQRPVKVTAAGFADICIETYGNMMRKTYSYFTLMRNVFQT